jgi:hypothetical protein
MSPKAWGKSFGFRPLVGKLTSLYCANGALIFSHKLAAIVSWPIFSRLRFCYPLQVDEKVYDLLSRLLDVSPFTRLTGEAALEHPFFRAKK